MKKPMRISDIQNKKNNKEKISMLTAYDYPTAKLLNEAEVDMILVGDSVGNVILGYEDTLSVTVNDMIHHSAAVARGNVHCLLVCDMPFGSYHVSAEQALENAIALMSKGRAHAVKIEGGEELGSKMKSIVQAGIPVMGHIGLRPQSLHQQSGYKKQGKTESAQKQLLKDARFLQDSGAFAIVLECMDEKLAQVISTELDIACIGIGSGKNCDGQVLVTHDLLGFGSDYVPSFVKPQADLRPLIVDAVQAFKKEMTCS